MQRLSISEEIKRNLEEVLDISSRAHKITEEIQDLARDQNLEVLQERIEYRGKLFSQVEAIQGVLESLKGKLKDVDENEKQRTKRLCQPLIEQIQNVMKKHGKVEEETVRFLQDQIKDTEEGLKGISDLKKLSKGYLEMWRDKDRIVDILGD